jgi:hypothetical protein
MRNTHLAAAFMAIGFHCSAASHPAMGVASALGYGADGVTAELVKYAELCENLAVVGYAIVDDFPGVFVYEVSEPFGAWYAQEIVGTNALPTKEAAQAELAQLAFSFFKDALAEAGEQAVLLRRALLHHIQ